MGVWYNEIDRHKAAWLRHLIEEGEVAHGVVDERPVETIDPADLAGFTQCHFFAGIGLWSLCLRRAGWTDDRPVWTGSCPCGPFSIAGRRGGFDDPRHLWPAWFRLIGERRPVVLFGEQSDEAVDWLDLVRSDLEDAGYATGAVDLPAAGFGGAHRRQRFGFVADADNAQWWTDRAPWHDGRWPKAGWLENAGHLAAGGGVRGVANDNGPERLGDAGWAGLPDAQLGIVRVSGGRLPGGAVEQSGDQPGAGPDWLYCRDRRWRPVEPGTCPLVDESPARMGRLRGYGDAIDVEAFTNLIGAYLDSAPAAVAWAGRVAA